MKKLILLFATYFIIFSQVNDANLDSAIFKLSNSFFFTDDAVGEAGETPEQVYAFNTILKSTNPDSIFEVVEKVGNNQGKLYALCGFYFTNKSKFDKKVEYYLKQDLKINLLTGCIQFLDISSKEIIKSEKSDAIRTKYKQPVMEWYKKNLNGGIPDIFGGAWQKSFIF